jgi:hypothetical protein
MLFLFAVLARLAVFIWDFFRIRKYLKVRGSGWSRDVYGVEADGDDVCVRPIASVAEASGNFRAGNGFCWDRIERATLSVSSARAYCC